LCAQIIDQPVQRAIADPQAAAVDHRVGKTGALQQLAAGAHIHLRVKPRRRAFAIGGEHDLAQRRQAAGAGDGDDRQALRRQRLAQMDQCAGQIVDRVKRAQADNQVERFGKRQRLFFIDGLFVRDRRRIGAGHGHALRAQCHSQRPGIIAHHQCARRRVAQKRQPVEDIVHHVVDDKPWRIVPHLQQAHTLAQRDPAQRGKNHGWGRGRNHDNAPAAPPRSCQARHSCRLWPPCAGTRPLPVRWRR